MSDIRYQRNAGRVFSLKYQLVGCPKCRCGVLTGEVAEDLHSLLYQKAEELDVKIETLVISPALACGASVPDHVHLFVSAGPTEVPQRLANQFKGYTSHRLRQKYPQLRLRLPGLWSRSTYVGSVGQVSEEKVKRYSEAQKRS